MGLTTSWLTFLPPPTLHLLQYIEAFRLNNEQYPAWNAGYSNELADLGSFRRSILHSVQHIPPSPTILDQYAAFRAT